MAKKIIYLLSLIVLSICLLIGCGKSEQYIANEVQTKVEQINTLDYLTPQAYYNSDTDTIRVDLYCEAYTQYIKLDSSYYNAKSMAIVISNEILKMYDNEKTVIVNMVSADGTYIYITVTNGIVTFGN